MVTPEIERQIRELAAQGISQREIGRRLGVSHTAVGTLLRRQLPSGVVIEDLRARLRDEPSAQVEPEVPTAAGSLETLRSVVADARRDCDTARAVGDAQNAQRWSRTIAMLMPVLRRAESDAQAKTDVLAISRKEIDEGMAGVLTRVTAILDRGPLVCADCGRKLSARLAGRELPSRDTETDE